MEESVRLTRRNDAPTNERRSDAADDVARPITARMPAQRKFAMFIGHCGFVSMTELAPHQSAEEFEREFQCGQACIALACTGLAVLIAWAAWYLR
jgi:hypothetical protein